MIGHNQTDSEPSLHHRTPQTHTHTHTHIDSDESGQSVFDELNTRRCWQTSLQKLLCHQLNYNMLHAGASKSVNKLAYLVNNSCRRCDGPTISSLTSTHKNLLTSDQRCRWTECGDLEYCQDKAILLDRTLDFSSTCAS